MGCVKFDTAHFILYIFTLFSVGFAQVALARHRVFIFPL